MQQKSVTFHVSKGKAKHTMELYPKLYQVVLVSDGIGILTNQIGNLSDQTLQDRFAIFSSALFKIFFLQNSSKTIIIVEIPMVMIGDLGATSSIRLIRK